MTFKKMHRWLVGAAMLVGAATATAADNPGKITTLIVPFEAGAVFDAFARVLAQAMQSRGHPGFVIENRPGANSIIGTQSCARAKPDGNTVCLLARDNVSLLPWETKVGYDPDKDLAPITNVAMVETVLIVSGALPVKTFQEFVAYTKAHPGEVFYTAFASAQLSMSWVKHHSGADVTFVPYKGAGSGMTALLGGQIQAMFLGVGNPWLLDALQTGKVRALAVPSERRYASLPGVPTVAEVGLPKFQLDSWMALFAPAGTPPDVRERLAKEVASVIRDPEFQKKFMTERGLVAVGSTPDEFAAFLAVDRVRGQELIRTVGARQF